MTPIRFVIWKAEQLRQVSAQLLSLAVSNDHRLEVYIRPATREKTHDQRKLWHAVLNDMALETGYTPAQIKAIVKAEYYGPDKFKMPDGSTFEAIQSSEDEDRAGYSRLIDFTYQFCADHEINIADRRTIGGGNE